MSQSTQNAIQRQKRDLATERFVAFLAPMFTGTGVDKNGQRKVSCDIQAVWDLAEALADEGQRRANIRAGRDGN